MSDKNDLREGLLSVEPISPERQQRFRDELTQIVEPRLPPAHRLYYKLALFGAVIGIVPAACGVVFDAQHRKLQVLQLLVWTASAGWIYHILRRGAEPLKDMQRLSKALAGIAAAVAGLLIFRGLQNPTMAGVMWAILGLLVFLLTNFINLWNRSIVAERTMREHMLRVEYRVADLAERLPGRPANH